jgi:4-amino-4-deoxy-L-arabinose transferase-like glycosyltransferase
LQIVPSAIIGTGESLSEMPAAKQTDTRSANRRGSIVLIAVWLLLSIGAIALAKQNLSVPGMYYDEAVFAGLAKDFVTGQHRLHTPGFELANFVGRPFPIFVQFYLGALKSWMLIPALALFGSSLAVVRLTTLFWGLLTLLFLMLGVKRWLGLRAAIVAGAVLVFNPTYFFLSLLDWGAAINALFCRCVAFYLASVWWQSRKARYLFFASFFLGLGFFNKVDFAAFIAGAGIAAICFYRPQLWAVLRARLSLAAICWGGFLLGAGPMIFKVHRILNYTAAGQGTAGPGELGEKLHTLLAMYDGSYFCRLMNAGGLFDKMYEQPSGVHSLLCFVLVIAIVALLAISVWGRAKNDARAAGFLLLGFALTSIGVFLIPGAVRIHHAVLAFPFPQLIIAAAFTFLWERTSIMSIRRGIRVAIWVVLLILLGSQLHAIFKTEKLLSESGGLGRWSEAFDNFCRENKNRADLTIVSLDWGFNEQLAFLTDAPQLVEPFWAFKGVLPPLPNESKNVYLAHSREYSLFRADVAYLDALQSSSENVDIQPYFDRQGRVVFYTIRFAGQ